jgi:hypothetical protein
VTRYDVFLSFSGTEFERVDLIREELERRGRMVFMDRTEVQPGQGLSARIEAGLRNSTLFVVYYSPRHAMRHACQFELVHAYLADDKEGGPGRLMVINSENNRSHIAPVKLVDLLYVEDRDGMTPGGLAEWIDKRVAVVPGTFTGIDFAARPRSHGGTPTVEAHVQRYGAMWRLLTALTREDYPMTQHPGNRIALLTGLPGAGKTMVVDDFVQYFGHSYAGVHRLDLHGVVDNYPLEIARVLNVGRDEAEAELERRAGQARQLWVVDNVPPDLPPDVVGALSMPVPGVATILVTEGGPTPEHGEEVRLDGLTDDEAVELVTRLYRKPASDEEKDLTAALAAGVSRHPMALAELARGAQERHGVRAFAEHVGRVLDGSADGLDPIVGLFAERLRRETDPDVLTLLRLAAECAPDALPVRFTCLLAARFGLREQTVLDALRRLRDTHLAAWGEGAWSVHAVIRLAARRLPAGRPAAGDLAEAAARLLADSVLEEHALSHARHLCDRTDLPADVRQKLLTRVATTLSGQRRAAVAARYFDRLLGEFPAVAADGPLVLAAARSHAEAGEHDRAIDCARQAGDGLDALVVLAGALDADGRFGEAEPVWQRVITHPDLAAPPPAERGAVELEWIRSGASGGRLPGNAHGCGRSSTGPTSCRTNWPTRPGLSSPRST